MFKIIESSILEQIINQLGGLPYQYVCKIIPILQTLPEMPIIPADEVKNDTPIA